MTTTTIECRTTDQDLLNLVPVDSPNEGQPTPAQQRLMNKLVGELRQLDAELGDQALDYMLKMVGHWTPGREGNASRWIDRLIQKIGQLRATRPATAAIEDGMYQLDGAIYKVQHAVHGSGQQYAKRLHISLGQGRNGGNRAEFIYEPGAVRRLRPEHRMTIEQAQQFGALYGTCCQCGRTLTDEKSIEAGIGPICASKL